ncbi:MAG TPA: ABC transporter permease [Myxococcales bacterium]|nr:ABC transporter permease [Myxococcales bacterium]
MEDLLSDLRLAVRGMLRAPAFTAAAVAALSLGIGGSSAIFSVLDGVVLQPLKAPHAAELVRVYETFPSGEPDSFSPADFLDLAAENGSLQAVAGIRPASLTMTTSAGPVQITAARITSGFFPALGINPARGRGFSPELDKSGGPHEVVLTDVLWRREFSADPRILGQAVTLDGQLCTVVGVMPPGFRFPMLKGAEALVPMAWSQEDLANRGMHMFNGFARLKPGVSVQQARAELATVGKRIASRLPEHVGRSMTARPLLDDLVGPVKPLLQALLGAVMFVLLIACANVASMLLARGAARQREMAIRAALGGNRRRLVRQLLTESLLLSLLGGALGVALATWGVDALVALAPRDIPRIDEVRLNGAVLAFALAVSIGAGLLAGLWPSLQSSRPDLAEALKEGSGGATSRGRARSVLVVVEVALALVLVVGAGLMIRTLQRLLDVPVGLADPARVLVADVDLPPQKYPRDDQVNAFQTEVLRRVQALPGVFSAALASNIPLDGRYFAILGFQIADQPRPPPGQGPEAETVWATPGYLKTLGIPLLSGRELASTDTAKSPRVVLVNEAFVRKYLPGGDAIGKRLDHFQGKDEDAWEIVGVIGQVHTSGLDKAPEPQIVVPNAQSGVPFMRLAVRASSGRPMDLAGLVRTEIAAVDRDQPFAHPRTLEWVVSQSVGQRRFQMLVLTIFGVVAVTLAALGIYGVIAYSVEQRAREFAIRMALGAQASAVMRMVVGGGLRLALIGVLLGLAGSLALTKAIGASLWQVSATDPLTFTLVAALVLAVAAFASWVPARRVTHVDPMGPLRAE